MKSRILVVDIGGTFVKLLMSERVEREFASGPRMTPKHFLAKFKETVKGWKFDFVSIGFPAPVRNGRILRNPKHLGKDWEHSILPGCWEYLCASLATQPCKRSAVISAGGACCFWDSERGLDPRWYGTEISCHSNWVISPIRTER